MLNNEISCRLSQMPHRGVPGIFVARVWMAAVGKQWLFGCMVS